MKKLILMLIVGSFFCSERLYSQKTKISKEVIADFSSNYYYKCKYEGNETLKAWAHLAGSRLGYNYIDDEIAIEELDKNEKFREELFKTFLQLCKYEKDLLALDLISIGMKATNAAALTKYIFDKYGDLKEQTTQLNTENNRSKDNPNKNNDYVVVDESAEFVGGNPALIKYLTDSLRYPDSAIKEKIEGKIVLQFAIDSSGLINDVGIKKGADIGYGLPEEAIRLVSKMPKWKPASAQGRKVKSYVILPITFQLPNEELPSKSLQPLKRNQ